jgi:hypothetical protein
MATTNPIDEYLAALDEPQADYADILEGHHPGHRPRRGAVHLIRTAAFRLRGKTIAGFAAFKNHLSYLPHSGSAIPQLANRRHHSVRAGSSGRTRSPADLGALLTVLASNPLGA